jgi:hypothetical protein
MPREHDRINYLTETVLECTSGKREARISDLSTGGCYIDSIATVQEGELVSFEIVAEPGVRLKLKGKVAYLLGGNGFGIKFQNLSDNERELIGRMVESGGAS